MFLREVFAFIIQVASWQTLAAVVAQHGEVAVADLVPWQAAAAVLLAASSLTWLPPLADKCLPLSPRTDISQRTTPTIIWYIGEGWDMDARAKTAENNDSQDESRTQWSPLGAIWGFLWSHNLISHAGCKNVVSLPLWLFVIVLGYYALALAARCGPLAAACYLLGASATVLADLEPTSVAGVSIAMLAALTTLYIKQEIRQLSGSRGPALRKRCEEATAYSLITTPFHREPGVIENN
jgi:hypothetical protein